MVLYASFYQDKMIIKSRIIGSFPGDVKIELESQFLGYTDPRNVFLWKERKELYVGHSKGRIAVYKVESI